MCTHYSCDILSILISFPIGSPMLRQSSLPSRKAAAASPDITPNRIAGATSEAFATIDVGTMSEYEKYRAKLAAHPKHKDNAAKIEASGAIRSIYRAIIKKVEPGAGTK